MGKTRVLTGITTTGTPHLGNYVGAIRPAIQAASAPDVDSFLFLADYHALIKCDDPARIERSRLEIAATWLAAGLDPERVTFYRQSDIPEIPELTWLLTCVTAKGLMNRSHAYKAATDANEAEGQDADAGVTMGLFSYPILMAADILMFNAHKVPVGRDQIQHIEMARDIGARFNHVFGDAPSIDGGSGSKGFFVLPEAVIDESVATLPGLDGRKMSKSYDNTIPLFEGGAKAMKAAIARVVTDSKLPGEAKDPDSSSLLTLYQAFGNAAETAAFRAELAAGLGWGEAKQKLFERIERDVAPMRARYDALIAKPAQIEELLQIGARKARAVARPLLDRLREAVGLRSFVAPQSEVDPEEAAFDELASEHRLANRASIPADITSPFKWDRLDQPPTFAFRIRYTAEDSMLSMEYASAREAGLVAGELKNAKLGDIEITHEKCDDDLNHEVRLRLSGRLIARGMGMPASHQSELDNVVGLVSRSLQLMIEAREEKLKKKLSGA
jgi:tryptophanyl-tRNA synthetase